MGAFNNHLKECCTAAADREKQSKAHRRVVGGRTDQQHTEAAAMPTGAGFFSCSPASILSSFKVSVAVAAATSNAVLVNLFFPLLLNHSL